MHGTQTDLKTTHRDRQRNSINHPCELMIIEDEIHKFPDSVRKSIRLNKHRQRPHPTTRQKQHEMLLSIKGELSMNLSICKAIKENDTYRDQPLPAIRVAPEFQTTADRMFSLRKRLSPVKKNRGTNSVDSVREVREGQRTNFLNIEKLQLIKIYSQVERNVETPYGQSIEERYLNISPEESSTQEDRDFKEVVISLRKTLREGRNSKWPITIKPRNKPFVAPFDRYFYRDFIWKVAFSNGVAYSCLPEEAKLKVYVGRGNNSQLVRSLLKRRSWWTFTQRWDEATLVWTQLKVNGYFQLQTPTPNAPLQLCPEITPQFFQKNEPNLKIMNASDTLLWDNYWKQHRKLQDKINEDMTKRNIHLKKPGLALIPPKSIRIQNHFPNNFVIGNKKALLYTMTQYYQSKGQKVFQYLPLSFHVRRGIEDPEYTRFLSRFYQRKKECKKMGLNNIWIVKPGELTNRGNGIIVCLTLDEIKAILKRGGQHWDGTAKTFILQQYIERPFLYQKRKFDLRHYMLATCQNGRFKGYWFKRGYIRTSSSEYTLNHGLASVHLTNDAVQKNLPDYGRYQKGNKLSYEDFQTYVTKEYHGKFDFFSQVYPKMKQIAADSLRASAGALDPSRKGFNFELFGLDFMIDGQFSPWLIQINSNPCLELSCPLLADIIPALVENTLRICVDPLLPPAANFPEKRPRFTENALIKNEFELVYDSVVETNSLPNLQLSSAEMDKDEDEEFEDDGEALDD